MANETETIPVRTQRRTRSAFDLTVAQLKKSRWEDWDDLANWIANELDLAEGARGTAKQEIEYCWRYYEQARMRTGNMPWPDAADLPSPYAPEYTDAVHARLMQTIFVDPVWTVEGWGPSAKHASFVEEFHQRAQEDERLQSYLDEWSLRGLVEGVGTLEISESFEVRRERQRKRVAIRRDDLGQPLHDENGPLLEQGEDGYYVEPQQEDAPSAEVDIDSWEPVRLGPAYDVVPYLDFLTLPAHARSRTQVWGYAKRFYRRPGELVALAKRGVYDAEAVTRIGEQDDRAGMTEEAPKGPTPVDQTGVTAQKELFECQLLLDLDGQGERWWRLTLHRERRVLLRCQVDDQSTRFIRWMPFPKPGTVDRGYSLIGHKLITVIEEDTARRNMKADRMALKVGQPIKRRQGALWEPMEQPFGPRAVIDVRDMDEVQPMQGIDDVPQSVMAWGREIRDDADRLIGQNDTAQGVESSEKRTLGEVQLRAGYAEVRINLIVKRMQEPLEELGQARHFIWKRTLAERPNMPVRRAMVIGNPANGIETSGLAQDGQITAEMLEGIFWFKPRGSVETADLNRAKADFVGLMGALANLLPVFPMMQMMLNTPPATKAVVEEMLRVFRWPDKQSFLGPAAKDVFTAMQERYEMQQQQAQLMQDPRMQILMAAAGGMGGGPMAGGRPPATGGGEPPPDGVPPRQMGPVQ